MSQVAPDQSRSRRHNAWMTFLISFSAAICMAGGFAVMGVAFVFASAARSCSTFRRYRCGPLTALSASLRYGGLSGSLAAPGMWKKDVGAGSRSMTPKLR